MGSAGEKSRFLPVGLLLTVQGAAQLGIELRVGNGVHGLVCQGLQNALVFEHKSPGGGG